MRLGDALLAGGFDDAPTPLLILDRDRRVLAANRRCCRFLDRDREELLGARVETLIHPDDADGADFDPTTQRAGTSVAIGRRRCVRGDGTSAWGELSITSVAESDEDADDEVPAHAVLHIADLREIVRAEEQLVAIVDGLNDGIVTVDPTGRIVTANRAATQLFAGVTPSLTGLDLAAAEWRVVDDDGREVTPPDRPELAALGTRQPAHAILGVGPPADERWLAIAAHPLERPNGECWVAVIYQDLSERRSIETALHASVAADNAKSELLAGMGHELRTPLNSMLGFAQLLSGDELTPRQRSAQRQMLMAGRHLLSLLDEAMDLEGAHTGRLDVTLEPVAIDQAVREAAELVQPLADASRIALSTQLDAPDERVALADPRRLRQVLLNLLTNGIKYNRPRGRVTVSVRGLDDAVVVRVADTGIGIAPGQEERIFAPFERLDAEQRGIEGAGVGLAVSRRLMELMGGAIGMAPRSGQGSTFWLTLRTVETSDAVITPAPMNPEEALALVRETDAVRRRVLCIEDDLTNRQLLHEIGKLSEGLEFLMAARASEGLRIARSMRPDAILLDLMLPDGPGEEVLAALRADPLTSETPVIIVSADNEPQRRMNLEAAGAVAYLTKPIDIPALVTTIDQAIASRN